MDLTNKELNIFVKYVVNNFNTCEDHVLKAIGDEYLRLTKYSPLRKSNSRNKAILEETLANCRAWLSEGRKTLNSIDLIHYCLAKNFFNSIGKR